MSLQSPIKTLYFDVDGTVLHNERQGVKIALADGRFEDAVRAAGFLHLVCVGNFAGIAHSLKEVRPDYDGLGALFQLCQGAFRDEVWFRANTELMEDPSDRARHIDYDGDWWYVDDLAEYYLQRAGFMEIYARHAGTRVFAPHPEGTGEDVLEWLSRVPELTD